MTEGLPTTPPDPPTPTPPQSRVGLVALAALCASLGGMLGGSAVGVVQAGRAPVATAAGAATPDAGGALLSQEANPETAGDGVMDDLDEAPSDAGAVVIVDEAPAEAGVVAAAPAAPAAATGAAPRRRGGAVVTSDNVPEGPAQGYVDGRAVRIVVTRLDAKPVEVHTAAAFTRMRDAAQRDRVRLRIASGFRTMAHQEALYRAYRRGRGNLAAVPGHSNHQSGHALDLNTSTPGVLRWLERNARRFGFRRTVPTEPWHWEWW